MKDIEDLLIDVTLLMLPRYYVDFFTFKRNVKNVPNCMGKIEAEDLIMGIHLFSTEVEVKTPYKPKHWSRL